MLEVLVKLLPVASATLFHLPELLFPVELLFCGGGGHALSGGGIIGLVLVGLHGMVARAQSVIDGHVGPAPLIVYPLIS